MYEDHTVEEKYLYNFSSEEEAAFRRRQQKYQGHMQEYQQQLWNLIVTDSPAIFRNSCMETNSALEIKYILNRIAGNDSRDTVFALGPMDEVYHADRLALDMARAFRNNTVCKHIMLQNIGLTDNGMLPLLHALSKKELRVLCVNEEESRLTDKTFHVLDTILADPDTKWDSVELGRVVLNDEREESFKKYPNLSFTAVVPFEKRAKRRMASILRGAGKQITPQT